MRFRPHFTQSTAPVDRSMKSFFWVSDSVTCFEESLPLKRFFWPAVNFSDQRFGRAWHSSYGFALGGRLLIIEPPRAYIHTSILERISASGDVELAPDGRCSYFAEM